MLGSKRERLFACRTVTAGGTAMAFHGGNDSGEDRERALPGRREIDRQDALKVLGGAALAGGLLAEVPGLVSANTVRAVGTIKIGFVSPRTGPAAGFGEPDGYVLGLARN